MKKKIVVIIVNSLKKPASCVKNLSLAPCVQSAQIQSFFWSVISCFWTTKNSAFGYFSRSVFIWFSFKLILIPDNFTQFVIFNPGKVPWNWIAFYQNSFVISPGLLYHLIRRDTGRLANKTFKSNPVVSSIQ